MPNYPKETIRNAKVWFQSFKAELAKLNISFDNLPALSLVRIRAAQELLALAGKAEDHVIHPMERPDEHRILRKRSALDQMLLQKQIEAGRYEDSSAHLFFSNEYGLIEPLLPEDYATMTPERFPAEILLLNRPANNPARPTGAPAKKNRKTPADGIHIPFCRSRFFQSLPRRRKCIFPVFPS